MSNFRTALNPTLSDTKIDLKQAILTIGSCFSDVIGTLLNAYKINTLANPFGVLYNPLSIHKALHYAVCQEEVSKHTYTQHQEVHLNYDFHSELSSLNRVELAARVQEIIGSTHTFLKQARWLIITYGTACVYERKDTGEIVANCHKQPASGFNKILLDPERIAASFEDLHKQLTLFNPSINIILTVSPVRHLKDTLELNNVSKSTLRLACHMLAGKFGNVKYFPSYEIMMDDLRDYRFYSSDMIHPSKEAEEYIWQKFIESYCNDELKKFILSWTEILTALRHKPFHPATEAHQRFLQETLKKLSNLENLVNVDLEKKMLRNKLTNIK